MPYLPPALLALMLGTFLLRFLPRVKLPKAIVSDTYFHLYCAGLIRKNRFRIPRRLPGVMLPHEYTYPYGYHAFLALFPEGQRAWVERGTAAFFDTLNTWIVFLATEWFLGRAGWAQPVLPALFAATLYALSPALLRIGSGPRAYNGSARVPGQFLYLVHLLGAYHAHVTGSYLSLGISILAGSILLFTAIFSTQVLFFFGLAFAALTSPTYLLVLLACVLGSGLLSMGESFTILRATAAHLSLYYSHLQEIFLYPHIRTWETYWAAVRGALDDLASLRWVPFRDWFFNERYHWHVLVTAFPYLLALPFMGRASLLGPDTAFLIVWCGAGLGWFWLTKQRGLLFLGEGERYLEAIVPPSILLLMALCWPRHRWILVGILAYSLGSAVHFLRDYLRKFRPLHEDHVASEALFQRLASLPPGPVLPVGWIHWQAVQRCPFPVLTYGGNVDTRMLSVEEFLLVYGSYPYPGKDYARIVDTYGISYILAERSCAEHYVSRVIDRPQTFLDDVVLLEQSPSTLLFVRKAVLDALGDQIGRGIETGDLAMARQALGSMVAFQPDSPEAKSALEAIEASLTLAAQATPLPGPSDPVLAAPRPRLLLIADVPHWIFDRHAHVIQAGLTDSFDIDIAYQGQRVDEAAYDLIHPLEWNLVPYDQVQTPSKWVTGIRSHISWDQRNFPSFCAGLRKQFSQVYVVSQRLLRIFEAEVPGVRLLQHGVDTHRFAPKPAAPYQGPLRVGWAGNRKSPAKGFETFIAPLGNLPGVELVFCGYSDHLLTLEEMHGFYSDIDVYVCSSSSEGHNNSLMEAAAMELAIVTTDVGTVPEYLVDGESALIVSRDPAAIRQAVERLRDDAGLRRRLGQSARAAVVPRFNWTERLEDHRRFFLDALAGFREAAAPLREAFLFEPDWSQDAWVEVVLAFIEAFQPGEAVALVLPLASAALPAAEVQAGILGLIQQTGRTEFPDLVLVEQTDELLETLRGFHRIQWVFTRAAEGPAPEGPMGTRLNEARLRLHDS